MILLNTQKSSAKGNYQVELTCIEQLVPQNHLLRLIDDLYAVAISLEVDGKRVLVSGDQYQGGDGLDYNYVYQNRFHITDYIDSAALYKSLKPDVILTGYWDPLWVQSGYFEELTKRGEALERLHRELLPLNEDAIGSDEYDVRIYPYQSEIRSGETIQLQVEVSNPSLQDVLVEIKLALPLKVDFGEPKCYTFLCGIEMETQIMLTKSVLLF